MALPILFINLILLPAAFGILLFMDQMALIIKIILDHISGQKFLVHATFDNFQTRTKVTFRMIFESAEESETIKKFAVDGNEQNFDRLASVFK